ncbi:transcriptional activator of glycolytic enzymes-domain-containing protein [Dipodascopsis uninucleata]
MARRSDVSPWQSQAAATTTTTTTAATTTVHRMNNSLSLPPPPTASNGTNASGGDPRLEDMISWISTGVQYLAGELASSRDERQSNFETLHQKINMLQNSIISIERDLSNFRQDLHREITARRDEKKRDYDEIIQLIKSQDTAASNISEIVRDASSIVDAASRMHHSASRLCAIGATNSSTNISGSNSSSSTSSLSGIVDNNCTTNGLLSARQTPGISPFISNEFNSTSSLGLMRSHGPVNSGQANGHANINGSLSESGNLVDGAGATSSPHNIHDQGQLTEMRMADPSQLSHVSHHQVQRIVRHSVGQQSQPDFSLQEHSQQSHISQQPSQTSSLQISSSRRQNHLRSQVQTSDQQRQQLSNISDQTGTPMNKEQDHHDPRSIQQHSESVQSRSLIRPIDDVESAESRPHRSSRQESGQDLRNVRQRRSPSDSRTGSAYISSSQQGVSYIMAQDLGSVKEIWTEYSQGLDGGPAIRDLEREEGTAWRGGPRSAQSRKFQRRKALYDAIESGIANGKTIDECCDALERIRVREDGTIASMTWLLQHIPRDLFM